MPDRRRLQPLIARIARRLRRKLGPEAVSDMAIPSYTRGSALSRWVFWRKLHWIERLAAPKPGERILDFGCGTGVLLPSWCQRGSKVWATDLRLSFAKALCRALDIKQVEFIDPDTLDSVIPDGSLDLLVAANVLEHVEDRVDLLKCFGRKLASDGRLIISGPSENSLYRLGRWMIGFTGEYHVATVVDVFEDALWHFAKCHRLHGRRPAFIEVVSSTHAIAPGTARQRVARHSNSLGWSEAEPMKRWRKCQAPLGGDTTRDSLAP